MTGSDGGIDQQRSTRGGAPAQPPQGQVHHVDGAPAQAHQRHLEVDAGRHIKWAGTVGTHCAAVVQAIIESKPHPEQGYRSCLGLMRLTKSYGEQRLEAACRRASPFQTCSYRSIKSILAAKL